MKAKTDAGPDKPDMEKPDYITNMFTLMKLVSPSDVVKHFDEAYKQCNIRYGDMKKQLAEDMVRFITPIREKATELQQDITSLQQIIKWGAEKAKASAAATLSEAKKMMGLNYYQN